MLRMDCPGCGVTFALPPHVTGEKLCPGCGRPFTVPVPVQDDHWFSDGSRWESPKRILQILDQCEDFPRPRARVGHSVAALFVIIALLGLLLVYFAFGVGIGWLTWWHATHHHVWMNVPNWVLKFIMLLLYVGPIGAGVLTVLLLFKPLLFRAPRDTYWELRREDEPLLYAFAERVADVIGAPRPDELRVNYEINAGAAYERRGFGLMRRHFVLTLGIPFIAGLNAAQLAGAMAKELGPFSRPLSSLLDRIVRRLGFRCADTLSREDPIDLLIESYQESAQGLRWIVVVVMFPLAQLTSLFMSLLMYLGLVVSAGQLRRMSYNSDRYVAALIGSQETVRKFRRITELGVAHEWAAEYVFRAPPSVNPPDDYFSFLVGLANHSKRVIHEADEKIESQKLPFPAVHPLVRNKMRAIERLNQPGIFRSGAPAHVMMEDFRSLSKTLTESLYRGHWKHKHFPVTFRSTNDALNDCLRRIEHSGRD